MAKNLKASLIISVYKNVRFLEQVVKSLELQTWREFEVIISEDGDSPEMSEFVNHINSSFPIKHLTQQDLGWRKNQALNRAIQASTTDWLVFIDGDCVLHPRFMEFHYRLSDRKAILAGKRIKLDPETSGDLISKKIQIRDLNKIVLGKLLQITKKGGQFVEEGIFINPAGLLGFIPKMRKMRNLKGCNMSFHKSAIEAINGFDEDYVKPAVGEDFDLWWRFEGLGYSMVSLRNLAVQYHLYHKESWIEQEENLKRMRSNRALKIFVCRNGLVKK